MTRLGWGVVLVLVVSTASVVYLLVGSPRPAPSTTTSTIATSTPVTSTPTLLKDVYPLYGSALWSAPVAETVVIGTTTLSGASVASAPSASTTDPGNIFTSFEQYYAQKLRAAGWAVDNSLAAGGHVGGQTGYRRGDSVILTRFHIDYYMTPVNAPSECPCSVVLSLFSASTTP